MIKCSAGHLNLFKKKEEENMHKKYWIGLALVLVIPGLLSFSGCAKKAVKSDTMVTEPQPTEEEAARLAAEKAKQETMAKEKEMARQRLIEEERLKEERLKDDAARREMMIAKNRFINEDVYFEFDSSVLQPRAIDVLKRKAEWLRAYPGASVIIEGHCDERGTSEYNLALGDRRAESAKAFLVNLGIDENRFMTISYGEERPLDPRHTEEAWAKNRRAHFVVE
jgi:peptidoglycan-associated lipoprotein